MRFPCSVFAVPSNNQAQHRGLGEGHFFLLRLAILATHMDDITFFSDIVVSSALNRFVQLDDGTFEIEILQSHPGSRRLLSFR